MCGVRFMAEGVKILAPDKRVVLVEPEADCPMARQIDPARVAEFRAAHPEYEMCIRDSTEFEQIYKLDVVEIPTNKPMIRQDMPDVVYKTEAGKFRAVIDQIQECHERQQPVLVGTISIEKSELLSSMLKKKGIAHEVLNAKQHEREAEDVYKRQPLAINMV